MTQILEHPCKCGGQLKRGLIEVEFFGKKFGQREAEICMKCGSQFLSQETLLEIESEVKKAGLFGKEINRT